jgi:hypothetical protein
MRIAALIALLGIVGCGAGGTSPEAGSAGATELKITFWAQGRTAVTTGKWTLRCAPAGGTLPQAGAACLKLAGMQNPFAPVPRDAICTDQYGGPQVALVTGTFRGRALWTQLQRRNGCEIARFKRLSFLVPGFGASGEA